jgi:2-C-methyl-D-erythritol 4-phosphate cytidylyltransferase
MRRALRPTSTACWRSASAPPQPPSSGAHDALTATAIVAAAGSGERLGAGEPKALVEVAGRTLLAWGLDALLAAESVGAIVVVLPPGANGDLPRGAERVDGGATRAASVAAGLALVETDLVVIHDAARPFVSQVLVEAVIRRLVDHPDAQGVIAAAAMTDTIKRAAEDGVIAATEDRETLWAAQTPQAFRTAALRDAYAQAGAAVAGATDEAMLVERAGGTVLIEPAPASNLKVTTPEDLRLAELLLAQ